MSMDEEELARRRCKGEEQGISTPEGNQALEWLAGRLRRTDDRSLRKTPSRARRVGASSLGEALCFRFSALVTPVADLC